MKTTREEIIGKIEEYFKANTDTFNDAIQELDSYNGYLGDDRCFLMDELDELCDWKPMDVLERAFYGWDDDNWTTDAEGRKHHGEFNPNREYFYFNAYGNLVSTSYPDYTDHLSTYAIEELMENRRWVDTIDDEEELSKLFDELENWDEDEDDEEEEE